jgi:hypothetical protein
MVFAAASEYLWLVIPIGVGLVCYQQADRKGRNAVGWGLLGFLIPIVGLIAVWRLKPASEAEAG